MGQLTVPTPEDRREFEFSHWHLSLDIYIWLPAKAEMRFHYDGKIKVFGDFSWVYIELGKILTLPTWAIY